MWGYKPDPAHAALASMEGGVQKRNSRGARASSPCWREAALREANGCAVAPSPRRKPALILYASATEGERRKPERKNAELWERYCKKTV